MKLFIKIWTVLFIFSALPILIINLLNLQGVQDQSNGLKGKEVSPFISSVKKKNLSPHIQAEEHEDKVIYLTFDDGPNGNTREILSILQSKSAHATFFLIKGNIDKRPSLVKEIIKNGNAVGCHSVSHRVDVFYSSPAVAVKEMKQCQSAIYNSTRRHTPLIRVPFGSFPHLTPDIKQSLEQAGFIYWDWNIDSEDWTNDDASQVYKNIVTQLEFVESKGYTPTVLLHDKEVTANMLPMLLDYLNKNGYKIKGITSDKKPVQFNRFLRPA